MLNQEIKLEKDWEFNVLDVYNYKKPGQFDVFFNYLKENHAILDGDILEAGVFRGRMLASVALFLKEINSDKQIYGFDTFSGFPPDLHKNDTLEMFELLYANNHISKDHYDDVLKNKFLREIALSDALTVSNISSSGDFSDTSLKKVRNKMKLLGLENYHLIEGEFKLTMDEKVTKQPEKIMAVIMDCDLYESYMDVFNFVWPRLVVGGIIFLDEYYSLKFPGARIATNEFIQGKGAKLIKAQQIDGDFERWYMIKEF